MENNEIVTNKEELQKLLKEEYDKGVNSIKKDNLPFVNNHKEDKGLATSRIIKLMFDSVEKKKDVRSLASDLYKANPTDINERVSKALELSDFANGGALVPSQFMNEVIPYLNANSVFMGKIPQVPMGSGSMTIPKETSASTFYWGGELSTTSKDGSGTYGDIQLSAKKLDAQIVISNSLLRGATSIGLDLETQIMTKLTRELAAEMEWKILEGTGSNNQPLGIYNKMASGNKFNSAGTTLANVTADLLGAVEKLEGANIMIENGQWIMSSRSKNYLLNLRNSLGVAEFAQNLIAGSLYGYAAGYSNYISNAYSSTYSRVYLLDLAKLLLGFSKNLTMNVFPYGTYTDKSGNVQSGITKDTTTIMASVEFDLGMYYNTAAAVIEQVNWK